MRIARMLLTLTGVVILLTIGGGAAGATGIAETPWRWPVDASRHVAVPYRAPAHAYAPGHRGIDLHAAAQASVHAPASGVIAFTGTVVDRPLLTIRHPGNLVTTLEPVRSHLPVGTSVIAGDVVGTLASGGHTPAQLLHVGVRLDGAYIDPMTLFGSVARAVLLPCCD